ncbi:MAG: DNA polymerase IV [Acidobacteriota bacterium]
MERQILHVEIGAFAVAVERVANPGLAGRPVLLASVEAPRAVVLCASEEARATGVRRGMPLAQALRRCRSAAVLIPNEPLYRRAASAVSELLGGFSPLLEPTGYGRAFLDLTGTHRLFGPTQDLAARIERDLRQRLRLIPAVGLACNKLVSRMASRLLPASSLCGVFSGSERTFLEPLPAGWLPELEADARRTLAELNMVQVGELGALTLPQLTLAFGAAGRRLYRQARGLDDSPVRPPERIPRVIVDETLAQDSNDEAAVAAALRRLVQRAGRALRARDRATACIRLGLRYSDGVQAAAARRLQRPLTDDFSLWEQTQRLLERAWRRRLRVRYLELICEQLVPADPADLFGPRPDEVRRLELCAALDRLRNKHGESIVQSGTCWAAPRPGAVPMRSRARDAAGDHAQTCPSQSLSAAHDRFIPARRGAP